MNEQTTLDNAARASVSRRRFLGYAGALAGAGLLAGGISACNKKEEDPFEGAINLGSGDIGVLNLAYALEQLEAAFYTQVILTPYDGLKANTVDAKNELKLLTDIRDHEIAHREFFRRVLGTNAIQDLTPVFTSIDFFKRTSVLAAAKVFEDTGVAAYNGAGQLLSTDAYLEVAGKIVSVEARHAAAIRDLIQMGTFADSTIVGDDAMDPARKPEEIVAAVAPFLKEKLNYKNLPTS